MFSKESQKTTSMLQDSAKRAQDIAFLSVGNLNREENKHQSLACSLLSGNALYNVWQYTYLPACKRHMLGTVAFGIVRGIDWYF